MKAIFATLIWFSFLSSVLGQEAVSPKHPEQEWNFLFTDISGRK